MKRPLAQPWTRVPGIVTLPLTHLRMGEFMDANFARELQSLKSELTVQFQGGNWAELSKSLDTLAKVGESQSCRELCLRAQSLRELMGYSAGGGRKSAGERAS